MAETPPSLEIVGLFKSTKGAATECWPDGFHLTLDRQIAEMAPLKLQGFMINLPTEFPDFGLTPEQRRHAVRGHYYEWPGMDGERGEI